MRTASFLQDCFDSWEVLQSRSGHAARARLPAGPTWVVDALEPHTVWTSAHNLSNTPLVEVDAQLQAGAHTIWLIAAILIPLLTTLIPLLTTIQHHTQPLHIHCCELSAGHNKQITGLEQ